MGLNSLFAIVTTTRNASLIKGGALKEEHYNEKTEIRTMQATRDILRNHGLEIWGRTHLRYLRAWFKHQERLRHLYRKAIRFTAERLHARRLKGHT